MFFILLFVSVIPETSLVGKSLLRLSNPLLTIYFVGYLVNSVAFFINCWIPVL